MRHKRAVRSVRQGVCQDLASFARRENQRATNRRILLYIRKAFNNRQQDASPPRFDRPGGQRLRMAVRPLSPTRQAPIIPAGESPPPFER